MFLLRYSIQWEKPSETAESFSLRQIGEKKCEENQSKVERQAKNGISRRYWFQTKANVQMELIFVSPRIEKNFSLREEKERSCGDNLP